MNKIIKSGAVFAAIISLATANIAFAQSLTPPVVTATPAIVTPAATDLTTPFTPEAPPVETPKVTQETGTSTPRETQATQETTETLNLPDPVLPVLDLGLNDSTDPGANGLLPGTADNDICINPNDAEAKILPPVIGNQIKVALMALMGAILGAILWVFGSTLIGAARGRGELLHIQSLERQENDTHRTETLAQTKAALSDALDGVIKHTGAKSSLDHDKFEQYCRAAADLEILGSEKSLQAHHQLVSLLSQQQVPSAEEITTAKSHLLESLQNDIMGTNSADPL